jgi:hypothetical protein
LIVSSEQVPKSESIIFHVGTDFDVIITTDNYTKVPLATYFKSQTTTFTVEIYPKDLPLMVYNVNISLNHSPALRSKIMEFGLVQNNYPKRDSTSETYVTTLALRHPLVMKNYSDIYTLNLYYRKVDSGNQIYVEKIPYVWQIQTLDWSVLSYLWMILSGVVLGKLFMNRNIKGTKFELNDLIWLALSVILAFLIFKFSPMLVSQILNLFTYQIPVWLDQYVLVNLVIVFFLTFVWEQLFERSRKIKERRDNPEVY